MDININEQEWDVITNALLLYTSATKIDTKDIFIKLMKAKVEEEATPTCKNCIHDCSYQDSICESHKF